MPFKKGQVANPRGRPPKLKSLTEKLRHKLKDNCEYKVGKTNLEAIVDVLIEKAVGGESWAIKEILDRTEGKPVQMIDQSSTIKGEMSMSLGLSPELKEILNAVYGT